MKSNFTRHPYQGAIQIFQYNWTFYAAAILLGVAGVVLLLTIDFALSLRIGLWVVIVAGLYWSVASLAVSHYVYDRSGLYEFGWLNHLLPSSPSVWINIHAGLDETSGLLAQLFPASTGRILDIYDPTQMTEPAIRRARDLKAAAMSATPADFRALPLETQSCEAVFVIFAAHELRTAAARQLFFCELHRVLQSQGKVILVEHLRDLPNFLAFGPGAWHFLTRSIWLRDARVGQFTVVTELKLTPFVRAFCWQKS